MSEVFANDAIGPALVVAALAAGLCACSGNGVGLDSDGQPLSSGGGVTVPLSADFDSIQANVFTPICSVCHIGATAPEGLVLDAQHSYNLLVNVPSTEVPSILRVDPSNPNDSYLIQKLEGHAAVGGQMPLGETPLPASTIAFIAQWITDGAQPSASASAATSEFAVTSVTPEDGAVLTQAPGTIVIAFTRELDVTRVDAVSVRLERIQNAGDKGAAGVPIEVGVPTGNTRTLLLTPLAALANGRYQVVLSGQPGTELGALDGARISTPAPNADGDRIIMRFALVNWP